MVFFTAYTTVTSRSTCKKLKPNFAVYPHKMDVVKEVLAKHQKELDKYKPITVEKHLECRLDVGTLLITDPNDFDDRELR